MKQKLYILWLMLLAGASGIRAAEAYAWFDPDDGSLNFEYDGNRNSMKSRGYNTYSMNTGSNTPAWHSIASQVKELYFDTSFSSYKPTTCYQWAYEMKNLTTVTYINRLNTSNVTNMAMMFCWCNKLASVDVSGFNTSNVTTMEAMFENCYKLTTLAVDNWNTAKVQNMSGLFYGCSGLTSLNVKNWNTSSVTSMRYLFYKCTSLKSLDVHNWKTTLVSSYYYMFGYDSNLETIEGLTSLYTGTQYFVMTSNVSTVEGMFYNCSKLYQLWLTNFEFGSSTTTTKMLQNCTALKHLQLSNAMVNYLASDACSGVGTTSSPCKMTYSNNMHPSFTTITPDYVVWKSGYFTSQNLKPYANYYNNTLTFYYDDYHYTRSGTNYDLNTGTNSPGWNTYRTSIKTVTFNNNFTNARPTSCYSWFNGMTSLTSVSGMSNLNTSKVTAMTYMFQNCSSLTSLDLNWSSFTTNNVTSMYRMFYGCSNLEKLYIANFNTANVTDMEYMFYGCSKLVGVNLSGFNTAKTVYMTAMFEGCSSLTSLDVSTFNTSKATAHMDRMFYGCSKLTSLDLGSFTLGYTQDLVTNCSGLTYLKVPSTANELHVSSCTGVGTSSKPCTLAYPSGFTPSNVSETGDGWYKWKSGYFTDSNTKSAYAFLSSDKKTLTFYYDANRFSRTGGTVYSLNTGSTAPGWYYNDPGKVTSVVFNSSFANARPTSCFDWFAQMTSLTSITGIQYLNTSSVTSMGSMFYYCKNLPSIDLSKFNTSNVQSMGFMFVDCGKLTSLNLSSFNTAKVTNMQSMFAGCYGLTSLDLSKFTIPSSNTGNMIKCSGLKTLTVPSTANNLDASACTGVGTSSNPCTLIYPSGFTPSVSETGNGWYKWKSGYFMNEDAEVEPYAVFSGSTLTFYYDDMKALRSGTKYALNTGTNTPGWNANAASITKVVFDPSFDVVYPTTTYYWFANMSKLTSITGLEYLMTDDVTNMTSMFQGCSSLTSLDLGTFDTGNVTTMYRMFHGCAKLVFVTLYSEETFSPSGETFYESTFVTSKASDLREMFYNCSSLKSVIFPGLSVKSSTKTTNMFYNCTAVTKLYVANDLSSAPATTFAGLGTATSPIYLETVEFPSDATFTAAYMLWKGGYFIDSIRQPFAVFDEGTLTFYYENSEWAQIVSSETFEYYDLNTGTTSPEWLEKATSITKVVFKENFKYARPTTCYAWFNGMTKLASITGMKYLNTSEVTNMTNMFQNCKKLTALDISGFTLKSGTTSTNMMKNCTALKKLTIPATAGYLNNAACTGVGTTSAPCELVCPSGFTPERQSSGSGWFQWKGGYFKDDTPAQQYPLGDVNHDGAVTATDAALVTDYAMGNTPPVFFSENADMNGDGSITVTDVSTIVSMVLGGTPPTPPTPSEHTYVDLGLPSGTRWADCNVGASAPEGYGKFFAWGETKTKTTYSWSNYEYCSGSQSTCQSLGTHIAGTQYDAATKEWGSGWVMPTLDQANELLTKCTVSKTTVNDIPGLRFKGPNGNSIFFPMTGYKYDSNYSEEGTQTYLWTDTKDNVTNVAYKSMALYMERSTSSAKANTQAAPRRSGVVIRAVRK